VEAELEKGKLAVIPCTVDWIHSQYGLITLKRHTGSPDEEAFIHLALEVEGKSKGRKRTWLKSTWVNSNPGSQ
jgi:hypothetical protein